MSSHAVHINNYTKVDKKPTIDLLSKIFILSQSFIGLNRFGLLFKKPILNILYVIFFAYVLFLIYKITYQATSSLNFFYPIIVKFLQYTVCMTLCYLTRNKIQQYYAELNNFDAQAKHKSKTNPESILIFLSMVVLCFIVVFLSYFNVPGLFQCLLIMEYHYYAFLFHHLKQRLKNINDKIDSSLQGNYDATVQVVSVNLNVLDDDNQTRLQLTKVMDFYYIIINAYERLTDGIKWQLLFLITTSFIFILLISYDIAMQMLYLYNGDSIPISVAILVMISETIPLIMLCMCCDSVRHEVRRLRELLVTKLFESKLAKSDRSIARALLALTKTRNLSFSLLRMVDLSITLPFSFLGLIVTYLIILLQFQKVINPEGRRLVSLTKASAK